jgi:hypothetical protein
MVRACVIHKNRLATLQPSGPAGLNPILLNSRPGREFDLDERRTGGRDRHCAVVVLEFEFSSAHKERAVAFGQRVVSGFSVIRSSFYLLIHPAKGRFARLDGRMTFRY